MITGPGKREKGFAYVAVLILMLVGSLIVTPLLSYMTNGLITSKLYDEKAKALYAADAGIEDAYWNLKNDNTEATIPGYNNYDFATDFTYYLPEQVNGYDVEVTLKNVWIPLDFEIPKPPATAEHLIIGETGYLPRIMLSGSSEIAGTFQIKLQYIPRPDDDKKEMKIKKLGVWIPHGFTYDVEGTCNFSSYISATLPNPVITSHKGGQAVVWSFDDYPLLGSVDPPLPEFPGIDTDDDPMTSILTFQYKGPSERKFEAVSWVEMNKPIIGTGNIKYTWDAGLGVVHIKSIAGDTEVESYVTKSELPELESAVNGDYFATGNSLLGGSVSFHNYHYQLYNSTTAVIDTSSVPTEGIPESATIAAAYLYWTGWIDYSDSGSPEKTYNPVMYNDGCTSFSKPPSPFGWSSGDWSVSSGRFRCNSSASNKVLSMANSIDLSKFIATDGVKISWLQQTSTSIPAGDLEYAFFDGTSWSEIFYAKADTTAETKSISIPEEYLTAGFRLRLNWNVNGSNRYIYIDNIKIIGPDLKYPEADPSAENIATLVERAARVNKVMFNNVPVIADAYETIYPYSISPTDFAAFQYSWYYSCKTDVTDLLNQWIEDDVIESNGEGNYTLGHYYTGDTPGVDNYRVNAIDSNWNFSFSIGGGSTGYPLGTPATYFTGYTPLKRSLLAHCGWSLVIIYTSPETYGHQLFLYDITNPNFDFFYGFKNNADFDKDGSPGGTISGFLVPDPIPGETLAGRITVFVGEGDAQYTEDYFIVNGMNMSNSESPYNNVWNSNSPGLSVAGVDIDHFEIPWGTPPSSGLLKPKDTSVQIDIPTGTVFPDTDAFTMSYIILSFRSLTQTGGALSYLIRQ